MVKRIAELGLYPPTARFIYNEVKTTWESEVNKTHLGIGYSMVDGPVMIQFRSATEETNSTNMAKTYKDNCVVFIGAIQV
jgi:hypothetical protein